MFTARREPKPSYETLMARISDAGHVGVCGGRSLYSALEHVVAWCSFMLKGCFSHFDGLRQ